MVDRPIWHAAPRCLFVRSNSRGPETLVGAPPTHSDRPHESSVARWRCHAVTADTHLMALRCHFQSRHCRAAAIGLLCATFNHCCDGRRRARLTYHFHTAFNSPLLHCGPRKAIASTRGIRRHNQCRGARGRIFLRGRGFNLVSNTAHACWFRRHHLANSKSKKSSRNGRAVRKRS